MPTKRLSIIVPISVLMCLVAAPVRAADLSIQAAEIVGYGIFESVSSKRFRGASATSAGFDTVRGVRFTDYTNRIPAVPGSSFGFQYVINSSPKGRPLRVKGVVRLPEGGMTRPGGRTYETLEETYEIVLGKKELHGFGFDEEWERVPGTWVLEVWHRDALLIKRTFEVYLPEDELSENGAD